MPTGGNMQQLTILTIVLAMAMVIMGIAMIVTWVWMERLVVEWDRKFKQTAKGKKQCCH